MFYEPGAMPFTYDVLARAVVDSARVIVPNYEYRTSHPKRLTDGLMSIAAKIISNERTMNRDFVMPQVQVFVPSVDGGGKTSGKNSLIDQYGTTVKLQDGSELLSSVLDKAFNEKNFSKKRGSVSKLTGTYMLTNDKIDPSELFDVMNRAQQLAYGQIDWKVAEEGHPENYTRYPLVFGKNNNGQPAWILHE
jgi:hypothetical protein